MSIISFRYIYTGNLSIVLNAKNIVQLLLAANKWVILEINETTIDSKLISTINSKNYRLYLEVAQDANITTLASNVENWVQLNFLSVVEDEDFLTLKNIDVSRIS